MREIDTHSLGVLEFHRIREIIAGRTLSPYGKAQIDDLRPIFKRQRIEMRLRRSAQMRDIIRFEEAMPLERIDDISPLIEKARVEGMHLDPKGLLTVKSFLEITSALSAYGKSTERSEKFPDIVEILARFHPKRDIAKAIGKAIDPAGEILNSASSLLAGIRRDLGDIESRVKQQLSKLLGTRKKRAGWQDDVITIRNGRYVIPVLSNEFRTSEGIVHDKSHSGATLFVEPAAVIALNNKLRQLQQDERQEMDRILRELTALVGASANEINADLETYGILDAAHAKATFALKIGSHTPTIAKQVELNLIDARHPLLLYTATTHKHVIPLNIHLDENNQGILVTGPNTGGKTVALKTIGLLTIMAMAGLEIPADKKSKIGIYDQVYADIGDEQSLELSLSTFSSHIRNIIAAVNDADNKTLVLFDEIGAGTDPREGAALAEVIIVTLLNRGCHLIATTHYSQLKTLPLENPGLQNASLEFDRENLNPTFKLKLGIPGASYAIDIARRLGLPDHMAAQAEALLGSAERSVDSLISKLDTDLDRIHEQKEELEERLKQARALEDLYQSRSELLDRKEQETIAEITTVFEKQLKDDKLEIDRLIKQIRESQADRGKIKESQIELQKRSEKIDALKKTAAPRKSQTDARILKKGDRVWIEKFRTEGEVVEMIGKKKAKIAIGSAFMTVDTIDLTRRDGTSDTTARAAKRPSGKVRAEAATGEFNPEIMLRGMTVDEATERLDKFLDDAVVAGVAQVYIVHGKGTGALRKNLSAFLKAHRNVESIRIGNWNEGGHGITIARLKT